MRLRTSSDLFSVRVLHRAGHVEIAARFSVNRLPCGRDANHFLPDHAPAFAGTGDPKALLEAPKGGSNVVIGIGLYTSGNNPRAVAATFG